MRDQKPNSESSENERNVLAFPLGGFIPRRWTEFGLCFECEAPCGLDDGLCEKCREEMGRLLRSESGGPDGAA